MEVGSGGDVRLGSLRGDQRSPGGGTLWRPATISKFANLLIVRMDEPGSDLGSEVGTEMGSEVGTGVVFWGAGGGELGGGRGGKAGDGGGKKGGLGVVGVLIFCGDGCETDGTPG
jgi:hypothetical protein